MSLLDGWRFCPRCGAEAKRDPQRSVCSACGYAVWAHAIPGVQALVVDVDARVLLTRRSIEPGAGLWDIPGGFLGESEDPLAGLRRELLEETGLEIEPLDFLGIWVQSYEECFVWCATWTARPVGGTPTPGEDEIDEVRWFAPNELPGDSELAFDTHSEILRLWAARTGELLASGAESA